MRRRQGALFAALTVMASMQLVAPAAAEEVAVAAANFEFDPAVVQIAEGDTVTWTNPDPEPHTVTADDGAFSLALDPGASVSLTFDDAGAIPYYCKLHGAPGEGMAGTVIVGDIEAPETVRIGGADAIARSIAWSGSTFPDGSGFALIGRSDGFADSLASGGAQGRLGAPLLLTGTGGLDARVRAELDRLGAETVYLLGGTSALSPAVESDLEAAGLTVRRVAGADRLATAAAAAETFFPEATSAFLVRGFSSGGDPTRAFADALAAGAAAAGSGQPILFSETARLSAVTRAYLTEHPIRSITVVGGTAALSDQVLTDLEALGIEPERAAGLTRAETAAILRFNAANLDEVVLVDGTDPNAWVDGFSASSRGAGVLLTAGDTLPGATANALADLAIEGLVCGATVTATACGRAETVRGFETDLPSIAAAVAGGDDSGAVGLYFGEDPTVLCYDYFGTRVDVAGGHLHDAGGAAVLDLGLESTGDGDFMGCSFGVDPALVADVEANPGDYDVDLHDAASAAPILSGPVTNLTVLGIAGLLGESEVPEPGDESGVGFSLLFTTDTPGEICSIMFIFGLSAPPTAAHIHAGESGETGDIVVTLPTPAGETSSVGCVDAGEATVADIAADPPAFYLNVHTGDHPGGAIRGQIFPFG